MTFLTSKPRIAGYRSDQTKMLNVGLGYLFKREGNDLRVTHVASGRSMVMPWSSVDFAKEWDGDASW